LDVVQRKAKPACALDDGVRVMKLIEAVQTANRTGRVVSLRS
jgi:predicted dehydrogenase